MLNLNYEPDVLVEDITTLSHDEWKLYRTLGIGGSDAAAVCGISPWKTARDLYEEKVHKKIKEQNDDGWVGGIGGSDFYETHRYQTVCCA